MSEYTKECLYCKIEFKTKNKDKQYCNKKCAINAQQKRWRMNPENKINNLNYQKEKRLELKKYAYSILGNKCVKCGITDLEVLNIDHIEAIGKGRLLTITIYNQIINFPEESIKKYQLLCRNCNWKKMITNNEHASKDRTELYAYQWQLQAMYADLISNIDDIKSKMGLKNNINKDLSLNELAKIVYPLREQYLIKNKINIMKLSIILIKENISIGNNKTYKLKAFLEINYPKDFSKISLLEKTQNIETIEG